MFSFAPGGFVASVVGKHTTCFGGGVSRSLVLRFMGGLLLFQVAQLMREW